MTSSGRIVGTGIGVGSTTSMCCWRRWWPWWWLEGHYRYGRCLWNHVHNYLWWNGCLCLLLLSDRVVKGLLHLFVSYLVLLHNYTNLLRVSLHHLLHLAMNVNVCHLCVRGVVLVIVRLEMPRINVICYMPLSCRKVLNEIPLLQRSVPHQVS